MPELPEVETVRRDLADVIIERSIATLEVFDPKLALFKKCAPQLLGKTFAMPQRRGKFLLLRFVDTDQILVIHLRMTGQIIYRSKQTLFASGHPAKIDPKHLPDKHTRFCIRLDDGAEIFFNDQRRFGTVELMSAEELDKRLAVFGVEPGQAAWTPEYFSGILANRKTPIKALLLNQNLIFGLGNIYADEVCFRSGVLPMRPVSSLTKAEQRAIFANCDLVLQEAIECRGTSIRDFVGSDGKPGGYAEKLRVYQRHGQECLVCGNLISKIKCAGRGTHYCVKCQR